MEFYMKNLLIGIAALALTSAPAIAQLPLCPSINYYLDTQGVCHDLDYMIQGTAPRSRQPQHPFPNWLTSREPWAIAQQDANLTSWSSEGYAVKGGGEGTISDRWTIVVFAGADTIGDQHQLQEGYSDCFTGWRMSYREPISAQIGTGSFTFTPPDLDNSAGMINGCLESGIVPQF